MVTRASSCRSRSRTRRRPRLSCGPSRVKRRTRSTCCPGTWTRRSRLHLDALGVWAHRADQDPGRVARCRRRRPKQGGPVPRLINPASCDATGNGGMSSARVSGRHTVVSGHVPGDSSRHRRDDCRGRQRRNSRLNTDAGCEPVSALRSDLVQRAT